MHDAAHRVETVEISQEIFDNYKQVTTQYHELQQQFEHLYRHQQGLAPYSDSPFYKENEDV